MVFGGFALSRLPSCSQAPPEYPPHTAGFLLIFFGYTLMQYPTHGILIHTPEWDETPEKLFTIIYLLNNHPNSVSFDNRNKFIIIYRLQNNVRPTMNPDSLKFFSFQHTL